MRSGGSNRRLPAYTGKTDYSLYRYRFLEHSRQCGWSNRRRGLELSLLLTEDAEAVLRHLPDRKRTDFETLDAALKLRFYRDVNRAEAERRYASLRQKAGQSLRQFAADVSDTTLEAHQGMSQDALQQLMIKAFVHGLYDSTTKRFVRRKRERYDSLRDALMQAEKEHAADDRGSSPKRARRASTSPTAKKLDELVRSVNAGHQNLADLKARWEKQQASQKEETKEQRQPQQQAQSGNQKKGQNWTPRDMSTVTCYACGGKGHYKWQCANVVGCADSRGKGGQGAAQGQSQGKPQGQSPGQPPCVVYYVPTAAPASNGLPAQQAPAQGTGERKKNRKGGKKDATAEGKDAGSSGSKN